MCRLHLEVLPPTKARLVSKKEKDASFIFTLANVDQF